VTGAEMGRKMRKQQEEKGTISFHISKKTAERFDAWCAKRMIVRERLWEMILDDLMQGELYEIPERYKPKIRITVHEKTGDITKTIDINLRARPAVGEGGEDNRLSEKNEG
jgi:hypothetical protein